MKEILEKKTGFTFIELLMVLAVLFIFAGAGISVMHFIQKENALKGDADKVVSVLKTAQNKTLASQGPGNYGVYFDQSSPSRYILFKGEEYALREPSLDRSYNFSEDTVISELNLEGDQVVFNRVSGITNQEGNITIALADDPGQQETIYIQNSGAVGLEPFSSPSDSERAKDSRHVHIIYGRFIDTSAETIELDFGETTKSINIAANIEDGQFFWEGVIEVNGAFQRIKIHTHRLNDPDTQFCIHRDMRYNTESVNISLSEDTTGTLIEYSADGLATNNTSIYVTELSWQ